MMMMMIIDSLQYQFSSYGHEAYRLFQLFIKKLNNTKHLQIYSS